MYNVWIVDDEPLIREGLRTLIRWEAYGFCISGEYGDGKEALVRYREGCRPELMVVDIRMPGMDGLELIEAVRSTNAGAATRFLILSGYAEFEYARRAIRGKVDGYLLKPVEERELADMVAHVRRLLDREAHARNRERKEWLEAFVTGTVSVPDAKTVAEMGLAWRVYRPVLFLADVGGSGTVGTERFGVILRTLAEVLESERRGVVFTAGPYWAVLLRDENGAEEGDGFRELQKRLCETAKVYGVRLSAAAGPAVRRFSDLPRAFANAAERLSRRFFLEGRGDFGAVGVAGGADAAREAMLREAAERLFYAVGTGRKDAVERIVEEVAGWMFSNPEATEHTVKADFVRLVTMTVDRLERGMLETEPVTDRGWIAAICEQPSLQAVAEYVSRRLGALAAAQAEVGDGETVVRRMVEFMRRHYSENLKLEMFSELFHYNAAYLGKLFRRHAGESFHGYLDKVRMERAKELLAEGRKVYEVAQRVGYADVDYFHAKFKKYVGMSPSAYRRSAAED